MFNNKMNFIPILLFVQNFKLGSEYYAKAIFKHQINHVAPSFPQD